MMSRLLVLLYACVGLAFAESRFLQSSLNAETLRAGTTITKEWAEFWRHMHQYHQDLKLNFEERKFRGAGRSGATFYVPSTDSEQPGKLIKVWIEGRHKAPMRPSDREVSSLRNNQEVVSSILQTIADSGGPQEKMLVKHFVKRKSYFTMAPRSIKGYFFEVMDYVEGITLKEYISAEGVNQSPEQLRGLVRQLLEVLYVLSRTHVIHGDLHPDNIMIRPDGQLVVIDMADAAACQDMQQGTAKMLYTPYDSLEENRKAEGMFTAIDDDTCIAFDAYSMGVSIVSLAKGTVLPNSQHTFPFYYVNVAFAALKKLDLTVQHLTSNIPSSPAHSSDPMLIRILVALLDPHRASRAVATLAMLERVLLNELDSTSEDELEYSVTDSSAGVVGNPERYGEDTFEEEEEEEEEEVERDGYPSEKKKKKKNKKKKVDAAEGSELSKAIDALQHEVDIYGLEGKKIEENGLTKFMPGAAADSFPPGVPIVARPEGDVRPSYIPNILFRNGLHAHPFPPNTDKKLQAAVLYNIFQLQLVYRHKLVLQVARESYCQNRRITFHSDRYSPIAVSVDKEVPTDTPDEDSPASMTVFEFEGQPLEAILDFLEHPVDGKAVHASLMNWENHVIVGGCIEKDTDPTAMSLWSGVARYVFREFRGAQRWDIGESDRVPVRYFFTVHQAGLSLQLHAPRMLAVGGGPMGLMAALEGKKSGAAVTIWEKRSRYSRMYCQQCSVSDVITRFHLTTENYLKSVEETLAAVSITVGINLQFQREILYLEEGAAFGKEADGTWAVTSSKSWTTLKEEMRNVKLIRLPVHVVVGADGSNSAIRKHALGSGFEDAKEVVLQGDKETVFKTRVLKPKPPGSAIYSLATLQFFKHGCRQSSSDCIRHDVGFDQIWPLEDKDKSPVCFIEYIEKYTGLQHIEQDILAKNNLHTFSPHEVDVWGLMRKHQKAHTETPDESAAMQALDKLLLARYLSVDMDRPSELNGLTIRNEAGKQCAVTADSVDEQALETFRDQRDKDLFSIFWIRTRRADHNKFAAVKDGVTVVLVGDATRDSFFPMGNGLARHIQALTDPLFDTEYKDVKEISVLAALLRDKIDVSDYNRHFERYIHQYIQASSTALLATVACNNERSDVARLEPAADIRVRNVARMNTLTKAQVEDLCPGLTVEDA